MTIGDREPHDVAICVCTFRRPEVLGGLLDRLAEDIGNASDLRVTVVVVDDDPEHSARSVVAARSNRFAEGPHYEPTGAENIAVARNMALETGGRLATWIAFTDDDCLPDEGWVTELVRTARNHQADCVTGACVDVAATDAPRWLTEEPFLDRLHQTDDGSELTIGPLKNMLVAADFLRAHRIGFDPAMGRIGGEDVMFFHALEQAGARHVHAAGAVVREIVPASRANLRYQLGRRFWYGNTEAVTMRLTRSGSPVRLLGGAGAVAARAWIGAFRSWRLGRPAWRWLIAEELRAIGRALGAVGIRVRHR